MVLTLACLGFAESSSLAQQLFWADANLSDIKRTRLVRKRSDLAAGPARSVLTYVLNANYCHVAFDPTSQKLYFTLPNPSQMGLNGGLFGEEFDKSTAVPVIPGNRPALVAPGVHVVPPGWFNSQWNRVNIAQARHAKHAIPRD